MVGLAWDCGAITTGEVTVPVVVALGSGIAATECVDKYALALRRLINFFSPFAGLGIVTIGSILPITAVQFLCLFVWMIVPEESITEKLVSIHKEWWELSGVHELKETLQITIPLIAFLLWILIYVLKEKIPYVCISGKTLANYVRLTCLWYSTTMMIMRSVWRRGRERRPPSSLILTSCGLDFSRPS